MAMMIAGLRALLVALVLGGLGGPVLAQSLPGLPGEKAATTGGEEDALARAIRQAAESGVSVVVLDSAGKLVAAAQPDGGPAEAAPSVPLAHDASLLMRAQSEMRDFRSTLAERLEVLPNSLNEVAYILRATSPDGRIMTYVEVLFWSLLLLGLARFVTGEVYGKRFARRFVVARVKADPQGYREKMPFLVFRFLMGIGGTLFNMAVAYAAGWLIFGRVEDVSVQLTVLAIYLGFFIARTVSDLWRMLLSPYLSQYRIPVFSDRDARRLYHWAVILAIYSVVTILFATWIADFGLNYNVYAIFYAGLSLVGALINIAMVLFNRRAISNAIRGGREAAEVPWVTRAISHAWAPVLIVYFVFGWLQLTMDLVLDRPQPVPMIAGAYGVFLSMVIVYGVFNYAIERFFERRRELARVNREMAAAEAREASSASIASAASAWTQDAEDAADAAEAAATGAPGAGVEVAATAAAPLASAPDAVRSVESALAEAPTSETGAAEPQPLPPGGIATPETAAPETAPPDDAQRLAPPRYTILTFEDLARRVAGILAFVAGAYALMVVTNPEAAWADELPMERVLDVIVILFIGYIAYNFFRIWIDGKIAEESVDESEAELGDEGGASAASRLATLLPLFRGAILAVVVVAIGMIALLEMGVNVSPIFAGAGVVGIAIGFGAQTLVRDIFSGAFFLIDDAFRKGEYIDIGEVKGTVEKISVRSFQLRHHLGALNTIPFGEIKVLTNYSRDWVIMKLPLRVTYDTDVEKVRKLIKNLGQELLKDPVIGDSFIQPLKSQGVIEMQDSAMIIRVKFMTKPGDQFLVRKKVYEDIRELFAREGIHFAHREVTVRLADGKAEDLTPAQKEAVAGAVRGALPEDFDDAPGSSSAADDR